MFQRDESRFGADPSDANADIRRLIEALLEHRVGTIVGPHGSGKSTLLSTLAPSLESCFDSVTRLRLWGCESTRIMARWKHLRTVNHELKSQLKAVTRGGLLIVDGAEQISPWQRRRMLRGARREGFAILATCHQPLGGMAVLYRTALNANLIRQLASGLIACTPDEIAAAVNEELGNRELDRVSNLRELWFELYDVVQNKLNPIGFSPASNQQDGRASVSNSGPVEASQHSGAATDREGCRSLDRTTRD